MLNEKRKPKNSNKPRIDKAVKLSCGLGAPSNLTIIVNMIVDYKKIKKNLDSMKRLVRVS